MQWSIRKPPHSGNPGRTPLPSKKLSSPPPRNRGRFCIIRFTYQFRSLYSRVFHACVSTVKEMLKRLKPNNWRKFESIQVWFHWIKSTKTLTKPEAVGYVLKTGFNFEHVEWNKLMEFSVYKYVNNFHQCGTYCTESDSKLKCIGLVLACMFKLLSKCPESVTFDENIIISFIGL